MRVGHPLSGTKRWAVFAVIGVLALSGCGNQGSSGAAAAPTGCTTPDLDTLEHGKIKVAVESYMPYTDVVGDTLVGLDAEILQEAARNLCLQVVTNVTDFAGMLGGVQSHRNDITIGGIGWGKERSEKGLFTDPVYYSPPAIAVVGDATYNSIEDFRGKRVGTISGYLWEKAIKATDGVEPKIYSDANTMFADLNSGRLDVGFIDPLVIPYEAKKNPASKFKVSYFKEPTDEQVAAKPDLKSYRQLQICFYLAQQAPKLAKALNAEIDKMYQNGKLAQLITKYGGDPNQFGKPAPYQAALRKGVDRDAGWTPPTV